MSKNNQNKPTNRIDLKATFPKDVKKIVNRISKLHRTTEYKKTQARKRILSKLAEYQETNRQPYTYLQCKFILALIMDIKKYSRSILMKGLFISLKQITTFLTNEDYRTEMTSEKERSDFKKLRDFEEKQGID